MFEYLLKPLAEYMQTHQNMGALIAGLIACAESMAIVGTIIPGSITMTLIGTMIGSGVLDIKLTLTYIIVGAFIGDYLSYWVGYYYRDSIKKFEIIKKNMQWMDYGENFITKHGVKSIIIGRFFGPMRSMIPLVAGVLGMSRFKFILGAIPSVTLWALVYLAPGVMLGAFALEMPTDLALQFIGVIIATIIVIAAIAWLIKTLLNILNRNQTMLANKIWRRIMKNPGWITINLFHCDKLGPVQILKSMYAVILFTFCLVIISFTLSSGNINIYDLDVFHLMQNSYTPLAYKIFTLITFLGNKFVIIPSVGLSILYLLYIQDYRLVKYLGGITVITSILVELIKYSVMRPRPILSSTFTEPWSFPSGHMALSTAIFTFLASILCKNLNTYKRNLVYKIVAFILLFIGTSRLYLCAHWLSDVIFGFALGLTISMVASILYHRQEHDIKSKNLAIVYFSSFCVLYSAYTVVNYNTYITRYDPPKYHTRSIHFEDWWKKLDQTDFYRDNKFGKPVYPLNIQWLGTKDEIEHFLTKNDWQKHQPQATIIERILHIIDEPSLHILPLIPQTYSGKTAEVVFSHPDENNDEIVLKLWPSFLNIIPGKTQLWLGSIYKNPMPDHLFKIPARYNPKTLNTTSYMQQYKDKININIIDLESKYQDKNELPIYVRNSGWDKKIIQLYFLEEKKDKKND
ncbi:MAG: phosphatase PAP2 family protein [Pseudomonadota bacterium]|nr:phosphatase PAP2 family protein [Pseudomonadota bacterium]